MKRALLLLALLIAATTSRAQELTLDEAIALALEKNADVIVERASLDIADASILRAEAAYEPALRADARLRERRDPMNTILSGAPRGELTPTVRTFQTSAAFVQLLPTGGTVQLTSGLQRDTTNSLFALLTPAWSTQLGAEVRQPLLQNRRIDPARRAIRIARADRTRAVWSLRRVATEVTSAVERAYWTAVAAKSDVAIRESALRVAEKQREDTKVRIEAGTQSEADLAQTNTDIGRRRGELAIARENAAKAMNALRVLIAKSADDAVWTREVAGGAAGFSPPTVRGLKPAPPQETIAMALAHRPELEELQTRLARNEIDIDAALDRVRPQIDLVASYQGRGLAGTRNPDALEPFGPVVVADELRGGLGSSLRTLGANEFPDASLGLSVSIPIGNTAAKQDVAIARAQRRQSEAVMDAMRRRIAMEVRNALASLASAEERIATAKSARESAEVQLEAERVRFEGGVSNTFFILTRQNELAAAQLAEVIAATDYRKAESELARATGTLLAERNITIAGGTE